MSRGLLVFGNRSRVVLVLMFKVAPLSIKVMFEARMGKGKTTLANSLPPPK